MPNECALCGRALTVAAGEPVVCSDCAAALRDEYHECDSCDFEAGPHACPCCGKVHIRPPEPAAAE